MTFPVATQVACRVVIVGGDVVGAQVVEAVAHEVCWHRVMGWRWWGWLVSDLVPGCCGGPPLATRHDPASVTVVVAPP
jgi:hypothetical protein